MAKLKKGILRRKTIFVDGKEVEVDTFDAKVIIGSGKELESIDELLRQEEAEKAIREAALQGDILDHAGRYGELFFANWLGSMGFTEVQVIVR